MGSYIEGEPVSEEAVAKDLGFADVHELRRWNTAMGLKVHELEHALSLARDEANGFRRFGIRMETVFDRVISALDQLDSGVDPKTLELRKLKLACQVVSGKTVDWDHKLEDWGIR